MTDERYHDLRHLANLSAGKAAFVPGVSATPASGDLPEQQATEATTADHEGHIEVIERAWPDKRLLDRLHAIEWENGGSEYEAILAEVQHRNLDF